MMSLWLNKKERSYLITVIHNDMVEFPDGDEDFLNEVERNRLLKKIEDMKV